MGCNRRARYQVFCRGFRLTLGAFFYIFLHFRGAPLGAGGEKENRIYVLSFVLFFVQNFMFVLDYVHNSGSGFLLFGVNLLKREKDLIARGLMKSFTFSRLAYYITFFL